MEKRMRLGLGVAAVVALVVAAWIVGSKPVEAQSTTTGQWTASVEKESNKIHLNLERRTERGGRNQMGHDYEFNEVQGLTREQAVSGGPVRFSLVREAGRIDCEGTFQDGKGSGTFQFTPNVAFVSAMKSCGFDFMSSGRVHDGETEDRLFAAATLNVTTALADDLTATFGKLSVD